MTDKRLGRRTSGARRQAGTASIVSKKPASMTTRLDAQGNITIVTKR